jgi:EAL domain-containing protein (putative c-di-GMP-specific phosphodiesterase class I)
MDVNKSTLEVLAELISNGFLLALDDFGTGYSSFGRMQELALDAIKIDKSLVDNLEHSSKNLRVCKAIIHLGHEFGFQVVVEGVEHISQKELLERAGCDFIQGYLYSKPIDKNCFESYAANF